MPIFVCHEPVNFRLGIDGLSAFCRQILVCDPQTGACFVFRNRSGTAARLLFYVEDGWWLCTKRFSEGRLQWWPQDGKEPLSVLAARELSVLLWKGNPQGAKFPPVWKNLTVKKVPPTP
jgi:hypothetical protein